MYLRLIVAGFLIAVAAGQLQQTQPAQQCEGKTIQECQLACTFNVTQQLLGLSGKLGTQFVSDFVGNVNTAVESFFTNPFGAIGTGIQNLQTGAAAGVSLGKILQGFIEPLTKTFQQTAGANVNPNSMSLQLVLSALTVLKNFTETQALRNNTQIDKILDLIVPVLTVVNDSGLKCSTNAVGGLQKWPMMIIEWLIGTVLGYLQNCYSLLTPQTPQCMMQEMFVKFALDASIWVVKFMISITPALQVFPTSFPFSG